MHRLATAACSFACTVVFVACASPRDEVVPAQAGFPTCLLLIESQYIEEVDKDVLYQATLRALSEDFQLVLREQDDKALLATCRGRSTLIPVRIGSRSELLSAEAAISAVLAAGCPPRVPLWQKVPALRAFAYRFVGSLDSGSKYLAREEFADFEESGPFGVGIAVATTDSNAVITEVYVDTQASQSGLRTGDRIIAVDGISVANLSSDEVAELLWGAEGSRVEISLVHNEGDKPVKKLLRREQVRVRSAELPDWLGDVAYVRLRSFQEATLRELTASLELAATAETILLDLRSNRGGLLDTVVRSVDLFVPKGTLIGQVIARNPSEAREFVGSTIRVPTSSRIFVLVDRHTASGAELFAEALRGSGVATLVGEKTSGRGDIQTVYPLEDGSGVKLTTGILVAGEYRTTLSSGLIPDLEIKGYGGGVFPPRQDPVVQAVLALP